MRTFLFLLFVSFSCLADAQDDQTTKLRNLYEQKKYEQVIKFKPANDEPLTAKSMYYIAMAHYMQSEDDQAMTYFDKAIAKGPVDGDMYYYKGMLLYYHDKFKESLPFFDKAIALLPGEPDFYQGKGESYFSLGTKDSAMYYFDKASRLPDCDARVFLLMGEMYLDDNKNEDALVVYQKAYGLLTPEEKSYKNCSFNLGLMQQLTGKDGLAKETFEKHLLTFPDDYQAMAKLIQTYNALSEFEKIPALKKKLYSAHKSKKLPEEMSDMFCFAQFVWEGRRVMAFECFDEGKEFMTVKQHFYVLDEKGKVDYQIDSESDAAVRMACKKCKYVLCLVVNGTHSTYWDYVFNDDYKYPELKSAVLAILDKKVKPGGVFIPGNKDH